MFEKRHNIQADLHCSACRLCYHRTAAYKDHLRDIHSPINAIQFAETVKQKVIGHGNQGTYWCGFCYRIVKLAKEGIPGDDERFNHISDHFLNDRLTIERWTHLGGKSGNAVEPVDYLREEADDDYDYNLSVRKGLYSTDS